MEYHSTHLPATVGYSHAQGITDQLGPHVSGNGPADHPATEDVDDRSQVEEPFARVHIGDVAAPQLVGPGRFEAAFDQICQWCRALGWGGGTRTPASSATDDV